MRTSKMRVTFPERRRRVTKRNRWWLPSASIVLCGSQAIAQQQQPSSQLELLNQIESLKARVADLEARQSRPATAAAVDDTVDRVMRDATRRSSLMIDTPFSSGWEAGK